MKRFLLLVAASVISLSSQAEVKVGDAAPSFLGKDNNGEEIKVADLKGKVVVAQFWDSQCSPCLKEMQMLESIQRQVGKEQLEVVSINFKENRKRYRMAKKRLKGYEITLTHDKNGSIARKFNVAKIPYIIMINKKGEIANVQADEEGASVKSLIGELNKLLSES